MGAGSSVAAGQPVAGPAVSAPSGQEVTLRLGQEAAVAGKDLTVRFTRVVADSRCRPGMTCIWQGEATLAFLLKEPGRGESTTAELHSGIRTGPQATSFAASRIELVSVSEDGGEATVRIS
ncbi:hypothetical protein HUT10_13700 [Amycolatopsis sp. Hca4]|nr:hypothetical protein HUT10_13700 [Amycolatopsis sp. Hca4]